jgi:hypothetical protein
LLFCQKGIVGAPLVFQLRLPKVTNQRPQSKIRFCQCKSPASAARNGSTQQWLCISYIYNRFFGNSAHFFFTIKWINFWPTNYKGSLFKQS